VKAIGNTDWSRREFAKAGGLLAVLLSLPLAGCNLLAGTDDEVPDERQIAVFHAMAQAVIPATDTPGAGDVGTGEFVLLALAHGLEGTRQPFTSARWAHAGQLRDDGSLKYPFWLDETLNGRSGGDWLAQDEASRSAVLSALDKEAFADDARDHPWRAIKALVLLGYYTSEQGASQELIYDPVPGTFNSRVPVTSGTRAISNDWTAVEFG
jgi:hypothetical protein